MATWSDVRRIAQPLPEVAEPEADTYAWKVGTKGFAWERPLRKADREALGRLRPTVRSWPRWCLTSAPRRHCWPTSRTSTSPLPHFNGYPAVLVRLERIGVPELTELLVEAWLARAPKRLAAQHRDRLAVH